MTFITKKFLLILTLIVTFSLVGCSSSKKAAPSSSAADNSATAQDAGLQLEINGDSDSGKAGALKTVFFPFNSSSLTSEGQAILDANAQFLKDNSDVTVQIEGHCDERGGIQFNIALGENRAKTTKSYLVSSGVDSSRVSTVSYGKERPLTFGHEESSWSQNRRSNFVVLSK